MQTCGQQLPTTSASSQVSRGGSAPPEKQHRSLDRLEHQELGVQQGSGLVFNGASLVLWLASEREVHLPRNYSPLVAASNALPGNSSIVEPIGSICLGGPTATPPPQALKGLNGPEDRSGARSDQTQHTRNWRSQLRAPTTGACCRGCHSHQPQRRRSGWGRWRHEAVGTSRTLGLPALQSCWSRVQTFH